MSVNTDIEIVRGDDEAIELEFTNEADNSAVDLTDTTVMFTVRTNTDETDDENAIIKKDVVTHSDPTNGKTTISLLHTETDVQAGNYKYDVQYKDAAGKIKTLLIGNISILQDVTKRT
jgi:hypothetical protein